MAVDLHTGDTNTSFPYHFLLHNQHEHILPPSHHLNHANNIKESSLKPPLSSPREFGSTATPLPHSTESQGNNLVHHMPHLTLQHHNKFHFSSIGSHNFESPWDCMSSPQSTLLSPNSHDSCWENTYEVEKMLEKMKLDERGNFNHHSGYGNQSLETSNVGLCSYQSPLLEQIRGIQLSRLRQEQIPSMKQKLTAYKENQGQISQQFQKKGKGCDHGRRNRPPWHGRSHHRADSDSEMRTIFLDTSGSRATSCGTGVFLPRAGSGAPSESRRRSGKGCSTVLIPARVVLALQLHFDQMSATSGPKAGGFPPLHDVLVSNRDGMYSLQKRQSRNKPAQIQSEMVLPQDWTY